VFPEGNPRKEQLDEAVSDRPAYIESADGHSGWANSKALALAGITKDTPDPAGGRIERDIVTKQPTGTLRESARELVTSRIPPATAEENAAGLKRAVEFANSSTSGDNSPSEQWPHCAPIREKATSRWRACSSAARNSAENECALQQ
jgi:hypothetical protein